MENVECSIPGCIATHSEGSTPAHLVPEPAPECPLIHPHHKVDCIRFEPFKDEDSVLKMPSYRNVTVKPEDLEYKGDLLSQIIDAQRAAAFENRPPVVLPKGIDTGFYEAVAKVFTDAESVLLKKHRDYGPTNISRSPGGPLNGLRVRMWDKLARINNLIDSGAEPENESLRDSFLDLMNYAAIAQVVLDGNWPEQ